MGAITIWSEHKVLKSEISIDVKDDVSQKKKWISKYFDFETFAWKLQYLQTFWKLFFFFLLSFFQWFE